MLRSWILMLSRKILTIRISLLSIRIPEISLILVADSASKYLAACGRKFFEK